jgi:hypothetical protein
MWDGDASALIGASNTGDIGIYANTITLSAGGDAGNHGSKELIVTTSSLTYGGAPIIHTQNITLP